MFKKTSDSTCTVPSTSSPIKTLKKGNSGTKSLAYTTLVRVILEYGDACWDPYREGQIYALDSVQKKAAKFAYDMSESNWGNIVAT